MVDNVVNRGIFRILILSNLHLNSILERQTWMKKTNFDPKPIAGKGEICQKCMRFPKDKFPIKSDFRCRFTLNF